MGHGRSKTNISNNILYKYEVIITSFMGKFTCETVVQSMLSPMIYNTQITTINSSLHM